MDDRLALIQRKLREHITRLNAKGIPVRCPVCQFDDFAIQQTEAARMWLDNGATLDGPVMPRLPIVCRRCFYTLEFAWLPILNDLTGL